VNRAEQVERLRERREAWDLLVIGGGATGVAIALDAAARGYQVALVEKGDFGQGTSSRSTKLVHGGVRYLEQGNVPLVMEALKERGLLKENAPHLVSELAFVVPNYVWWEAPFYGVGLRLYDLLAGKYGFGASKNLSKEETLERLPTIKTEGLRGGVVYYDGQFDDTRLLTQMAMTAVEQGAVLVNYCPVVGLVVEGGMVAGARVRDEETGAEYELRARGVINATGAYSDRVRRMGDAVAAGMVAPSQGVHLVFRRVVFAGGYGDHGAAHQRRAGDVRDSVARAHAGGDDGHGARGCGGRAEGVRARGGVHSGDGGAVPASCAGAGGCVERVGGDPSFGESAGGGVDGGLVARSQHPRGPERVADDRGGEMDDGAEDGGGLRGSGGAAGGLEERDCVTKRLRIHGYHHHAAKYGARLYLWQRRHCHQRSDPRPARSWHAPRFRTSLHRSGGDLGGALGNGPHG
jgi:glycine/D-amino acid oxidase-like deaminating enzyme